MHNLLLVVTTSMHNLLLVVTTSMHNLLLVGRLAGYKSTNVYSFGPTPSDK